MTSRLRRSRERRRGGLFALLLFQAVAFTAGPAADAVHEAEELSESTRAEAGHEPGEAGHCHLLCELTRTLSCGSSVSVVGDLRPQTGASPCTRVSAAPTKRPAPSGGSGPRAPPAD